MSSNRKTGASAQRLIGLKNIGECAYYFDYCRLYPRERRGNVEPRYEVRAVDREGERTFAARKGTSLACGLLAITPRAETHKTDLYFLLKNCYRQIGSFVRA